MKSAINNMIYWLMKFSSGPCYQVDIVKYSCTSMKYILFLLNILKHGMIKRTSTDG